MKRSASTPPPEAPGRLPRSAGALLLALLLGPGSGSCLSACSSRTPLVPRAPRPAGGNAQPVPYPPPSAKTETLAMQRSPECLWRDGYYEFKAGDYQWHKGQWVRPAPGCAWVPPDWEFEGEGSAKIRVERPSLWVKLDHSGSCPPPEDCDTLSPSSSTLP